MLSNKDLETWQEEIKGIKKLGGKKILAKNKKDFVKKTEQMIEKSQVRNRDNPAFFQFNKNPPIKNKDFKLQKGVSLGVDRTTDKKLKSGKYPIDLTLDLHGLKIEDAYFKLKNTIELAFENGHRLILVITGKGLHSKIGDETIKSSVPNWLRQPEFASKIIKYTDAVQKHGGSGALYVLLKRSGY